MAKLLTLGGLFVFLLFAVAFVVLRPSYEQASKDYQLALLADLAKRAQSYRDATGTRPASIQEMAPPLCRGSGCVLTSDELQRVENADVRGNTICMGLDCVGIGGADAGNQGHPGNDECPNPG